MILNEMFVLSIHLSRLIIITLILMAMIGIILYTFLSARSDIRATGTIRKIGKLNYHESYGWGRQIFFDDLQTESPRFRKIGGGKPRLVYPHEEEPPFDGGDRIRMVLSTAPRDKPGQIPVIREFEVLESE